MKRLILTSSSGSSLMRSDLADVVIPFFFRFVWGPLPSPDELAAYLGPRSDEQAPGLITGRTMSAGGAAASKARKDLGLVEFCEPLRDDRVMVRSEPERSIATDLVARLFPFSSGDRGQVDITPC